jgi:hypothetical protein
MCCCDGVIHWDVVSELASLEVLFKLHMQDDITSDALEMAMLKLKVVVPDSFHPQELCSLDKRNIFNASRNIAMARNDLVLHLNGYFEPEQSELLHQWLGDSHGYTDGRRVEADIWMFNNKNRRSQASTESTFILRDILFQYCIPLHKIAPLWVSFYALIMRRVIPLSFFLHHHLEQRYELVELG